MEPFEFTLDMTPAGAPLTKIRCSEGDIKRPYVAKLKYCGSDYTIPEGSTVELHALKPDENIYIHAATWNGNLVYFETETQLSVVAGDVLCEIVLVGTDGSQMGTWNFILTVEPNPIVNGVSSDSQITWIAEAQTAASNAKTSETNAKASETAAGTSAANAKASETNSSASETAAAASATAAKTSETNAKASETAATTSKTDAASSAKESKSYAVGGTGTRSGEDTDNSKYWCQQAHDISTGVTGVKGDSESTYRKGDVNITKANIGLGNVDNTSDADKPISTAGQTALDSTNSAVSDIIRKVNQIDYTKSWADILADCESGNASRWYSIGDTITEPWTDTSNSTAYDNPWRVNSFADETLQDGTVHHGMWLQNVYAHPFGVQFSHQRAFCKCPDGLSAGTYHIKFAQAWGKALANTPYQFTIAADVAAGCRLAGFYYMADNEPSTYKVYVYSADGKTIIETCVVTQGEGGTDLGTLNYTTRNGNLNSMQETAYGWNRNLSSAVRQYLNSEADKNLWWTAYDEWDIAPDQLSSKAGYLSGLPDDMKAVIQAVKTTTYTNTVQDGGGADITYDKVILPSLEQMYINPQIAGEGAVHEYWKQVNGTDTPYPWYTNTPALIHYAVENHTNAQYVRLRSASRYGAFSTWTVYQSGGVCGGCVGACGSLRFAPLVFI